jgi:hypothetical protein
MGGRVPDLGGLLSPVAPPTTPILLLSVDVAAAAAIAAAAAAWLLWRGLRAVRGSPSGGGCGCGSGPTCTPSGRDAAEVRAAADRMNRRGGPGAR